MNHEVAVYEVLGILWVWFYFASSCGCKVWSVSDMLNCHLLAACVCVCVCLSGCVCWCPGGWLGAVQLLTELTDVTSPHPSSLLLVILLLVAGREGGWGREALQRQVQDRSRVKRGRERSAAEIGRWLWEVKEMKTEGTERKGSSEGGKAQTCFIKGTKRNLQLEKPK